MNADGKAFIPPIVFIDEINSQFEQRIKLLRNLGRILALSCVLASTNAKVNNLLNTSSDSAPRKNAIWVHAIRALPKASMSAILHLLNWNGYADDNGNICAEGLLEGLEIQYESVEFNLLENLLFLMRNQSETCLQGTALDVYSAFKEQLWGQRGKQLDTKAIWKHILPHLRQLLIERKPSAFSGYGPFHSLAMLSDYQMVVENEIQLKNQRAPSAEIVLGTINGHYYFFGRPRDKNILPFGYSGGELSLNGIIYETCSHFKLFSENLFFCMATWIQVDMDTATNENRVSVASVVTKYIHKLRNAGKNKKAVKNNSSAQECVVHWGLCYSTFRDFASLNPGLPFLERFIETIQIDPDTIDMVNSSNIKPNTKVKGLMNPVRLSSCVGLVAFLSQIQIPYLLPSDIISEEIRGRLNGLCQIGKCNRLPDNFGIDLEFDLIYNNEMMRGFVECKYVDVNLSKLIVLEYIIRARRHNSPFSMIITYSMQRCLKSAALWSSEFESSEVNEEESTTQYLSDKMVKMEIAEKGNGRRNKRELNRIQARKEKAERKRKKEESMEKIRLMENQIDNVSIYSIFYEGNQMKAVPLIEFEDPKGVFLIIQTNFIVPKI